MGKGSRRHLEFQRRDRKKRAKRGEKGPAYTKPKEGSERPYSGMKIETDMSIFSREPEEERPDYRENNLSFTPENTKTKKGRVPKIVMLEDVPSYLANYCMRKDRKKLEDDHCYSECEIRDYCEGDVPWGYNFPVGGIKDAFKIIHPENEISLAR
ncbi:MAG: hypothetical protein V3U72_02050 [Candidatus Aenigmarchaeota archaeon]